MQHVYWVIEGKLAGRAGPSLYPWNPFEMREAGIGAVVSLADGADADRLSDAGLVHFGAPLPMVLLETEVDRRRFLTIMPPLIAFYDECESRGHSMLVHCHYGCDRTGAVLGCLMVARHGMSSADAIAHVRGKNPHAYGAFGYAEAVETFQVLFREVPELFPPTPKSRSAE